MSDMWMPPQTTRPPFFTAFSARGTSGPTGAKIIAASSGSGGISSWHLVRPPRQTRAGSFRKSLRRLIANPGERVDAAALPDSDLDQNVRGGAKPVKAERL